MSVQLPPWAMQMVEMFRSGSLSQFILHGNVFDFFPAHTPKGQKLLSLKAFLEEVMFASYDVVLHYDRGKGLRASRGGADFGSWLDQVLGAESNALAGVRESGKALELIDRYLLRTLNLQTLARSGGTKPPHRIAIVIDFAEFVVPSAQAIQLTGEFGSNIVKIMGWANDPAILQANIVTVLISEGLGDISGLVVNNPHTAKLRIPLPDGREMLEYLKILVDTQFPELPQVSTVPVEVLAGRLVGLSRIGARTAIAMALRNDRGITPEWLSRMRKDLIERECEGLLDFIESPFTLDNVAGLDAAKAWLREDAALIREGDTQALPMGYLIAGRIGTGKTFLVQCWAGELGIPCVVLKNFRDKWMGATEGNLEKIFTILHALGQVVVFVDEADQAAGRRDGGTEDGGLSGRVYSMLAKEMADTRNRGRIFWVFATSRPDLLEVDLKRQGRLDVHIPLFGPETPEEITALLQVVARKLQFPLDSKDVPPLPEGAMPGGNELEALLVRAIRLHKLQKGRKRSMKKILAEVFAESRPNPNARKLEYMDLAAVRECTDARFLPERFRSMTAEEIDRRMDELRRFI